MYFHPSSFMGWFKFKSSCFKTDLLDVRRWRGRDDLDPGAGVRHEEHGHEPHRGRAPRDDQRVRHRRLWTGAQYTSPCFVPIFDRLTNIFYRLKLFLFDQIEFPEFCDMMASKMSDNDDEEAVRWEQLFSRKTFISLQLSTGTFALAFSHIIHKFPDSCNDFWREFSFIHCNSFAVTEKIWPSITSQLQRIQKLTWVRFSKVQDIRMSCWLHK